MIVTRLSAHLTAWVLERQFNHVLLYYIRPSEQFTRSLLLITKVINYTCLNLSFYSIDKISKSVNALRTFVVIQDLSKYLLTFQFFFFVIEIKPVKALSGIFGVFQQKFLKVKSSFEKWFIFPMIIDYVALLGTKMTKIWRSPRIQSNDF